MGIKDKINSWFGRKTPMFAVIPNRNDDSDTLPEVSSKGTPWVGGRPSGYERNPNFTSAGIWAEFAYEMLRTDPKLAGINILLQNTLLSAKWRFISSDKNNPNANRNAEYANKAFGFDGYPCKLSGGSWESELRKIYMYLPIGFRVLEEVYRVDNDNLVWLDSFSDMEPSSIKEWTRDADGKLIAVVQKRVSDWVQGFQERVIPADKVCIFTNGMTGENYEGVGMLRPCVSWYNLKAHIQEQMGIGAERWATPTPRVEVDRKLGKDLGYSDAEITQMIIDTNQSAIDYLSQERSVVTDTPAVRLMTYGEKAYDATSLLTTIDHANQEMATAFLAHFVELGVGEDGSRAVGQIHWNAWRMSIINILDYIASVITGGCRPGGGTIARLLQWNFYGEESVPFEELPKLVHMGLEVDGLADAIGNIANLINAGALTPDNELENRLRRLLGLGVISSSEAQRSVNDRLNSSATKETTGISDSIGGRPSIVPKESF